MFSRRRRSTKAGLLNKGQSACSDIMKNYVKLGHKAEGLVNTRF